MPKKKPNILLFGIDSLRRDHMSHYGYHRLTTPHITKYAEGGVTFNNCFSPSIPTTPGYGCMFTGRDCFGTNTVALRHKGDMAPGVKTLAEVLREHGYTTTSVGFEGNPVDARLPQQVEGVEAHAAGLDEIELHGQFLAQGEGKLRRQRRHSGLAHVTPPAACPANARRRRQSCHRRGFC